MRKSLAPLVPGRTARVGGCIGLAMVLLGAGLALAGMRGWEARYPGVQHPGGLGGLRLTTLGLGRCLTMDRHFITPDGAAVVSAWLEARGWRPIIPLTPAWQIGALVAGRYYYAAGARRGPTEVLQRQALCLAL